MCCAVLGCAALRCAASAYLPWCFSCSSCSCCFTDTVCALLQQQQLPEASSSGLQQQCRQPVGGQISSTLALNPPLPAKRLNPEDAASPHSLAKLSAKSPTTSSAKPSGIKAAEGNASKGSSQNAFALLMKASKSSAKRQPMGTAGGQLSAEGVSHSQGNLQGSQTASHAKAAASWPQGGWQDTLQRVAADPER